MIANMETQLKQPHVLVLEDDESLATAVTAALTANQFSVKQVQTIEDGLEYMNSDTTVDAVWLDHYLLGTGDGLDFVVMLKSEPKWKGIPVFVVSNSADGGNIKSYLQLGVNNYYTKTDFDIQHIISDIKYTLQRK